MTISGATDPINPTNPFFYSFKPFWAKIWEIKKSTNIILTFKILKLFWPYPKERVLFG